MKLLTLAILIVLTLASGLVWLDLRDLDVDDGRPVLVWTTDVNPARVEQAAGFNRWLADRGLPPVEVRLDMGRNTIDKKMIQGVSGVGSDVFDMFTAAQMHFFQEAGLIEDVTEEARELGFSPESTYPVCLPEITRRDPQTGDLRQFSYPLNLGGFLYYVNKDTFEKHGQLLPPRRWDLATFEQYGVAFVEAANKDRRGEVGRVFYVDAIEPFSFRRSFGASVFNETMTACTLDSPESITALETLRRWTYDLRLVPSAADLAAMSSNQALFGGAVQLWADGRFAMTWSSRHLLIQARLFNRDRVRAGGSPMRLMTVEPPHAVFPNTTILVRSAGVYVDSDHKDLVRLFLAYLASDEYNLQLVRDADALPPNPAILTTEAYLRPAKDEAAGIYPATEWDVHGAFAEACLELGVASSYSPFVLKSDVDRVERRWRESAMADPPLATPADAMRAATLEINRLIAEQLAADPELAARHADALERQAEIDRLKQDGEPIPADLIDNPYHLALYRATGRLTP